MKNDQTNTEASGITPMAELNTVGELAFAQQKRRLLASMFEVETEPVRLQHYVLLEQIGHGGMGVVYAAYDEALERKVAIKLLHARGSGDAQARLRREAKAMARVSHQNVVQIYEIGEVDRSDSRDGPRQGVTFIVMEFIRGLTLRQWLAQERRSTQEILEIFITAGAGLAAAHAKGLVHRDVKPDNVMITRDDRVVLMDFGIARRDQELLISSVDGEMYEASATELTAPGAVLGTPAYMAPEQLRGAPTDAKTDQFCFCVALWEAVYGERPYVGANLPDLATKIEASECSPATGHGVPTWLRTVLERGLRPQPEQRWPSVPALLRALADNPALRRRKWWVGAGVVGALLSGTWGLTYVMGAGARACMGAQDKLAGVWDSGRRAEVEVAINGTKLSYAPQMWTRVESGLDIYTTQWVAARTEACEATRRGEQTGELLDLRMACLDERLTHVRVLVDMLSAADDEVVRKAAHAVAGLPNLNRCADAGALMSEVRPPDDPEVARKAVALAEQLAVARALEKAGKYDEGLAVATAVVAEAGRLGYEPLEVRAWLRQGSLQDNSGDHQGAEATLEKAYVAAVGQRMTTEAASASAELMYVVGNALARIEDGRRWAVDAEPLSRAAETGTARVMYFNNLGTIAQAQGDHQEARRRFATTLALRQEAFGPAHLNVATSLNNLGAVAASEGNYEEASGFFKRALAIREQRLGSEHPDVAVSLGNLGVVADMAGDYEQARRFHERALAINIRALGQEHPAVASSLHGLGSALDSLGEYEQARSYYERALTVRRKTLGPKHPDVARSLDNLGLAAYEQGEYEQARSYHERALEIFEEVLGPDHQDVASALNNLGLSVAEEGEVELARRYQARALTIWEVALGPDHPNVALSLDNLGRLAQLAGELEIARDYHERALEIRNATLSADHPDVAESLDNLGRVAESTGAYEQALRYYEGALAIRAANAGDPKYVAQTRFGLARVLWQAPAGRGRDQARAQELGELARATFAEAGERSAKDLEAVDAWLDERD